MFGRKNKILFWILAGYVAGNVVSAVYGKKGTKTLKSQLADADAKGEGKFRILFDDFANTHTNMFNSIKDEVMTEENIARFNEYKADAIKLLNSYKGRAMIQVEELKKQGKSYLKEAQVKLQEGYEDAITEVNRIKDMAPEKSQELKIKLKEVFEDIKEQMQQMVK